MELLSFKLDYGWEVSVPEGWIMERQQEAGSYIFYPEDFEDETTIYASALRVEHNGILAPEYDMKMTFERSIPEGSQEVGIITNVHCKAFFLLNGDGSYRIGAGYFEDGNLLSLNVYAKNEEKARAAAAGFAKVTFTRGMGVLR